MRSLLLVTLWLGVATTAAAQIEVSTEPLVAGQPVTLEFAEPTDTVTVTYRPNSQTSTSETFTLGGQRTLEWTPEHAGVVQVTTADATRNLSVRFTSLPGLGVLIMTLAGLILFGGATFAMTLLLRDGHRIEIDPTQRPDT